MASGSSPQPGTQDGPVIDLRDGVWTAAGRGAPAGAARRPRHHSESMLPPAVNGILAALTVAAISLLGMLLVTVVGWVLAADHSSVRSMFDVAVYGWLSMHLLPVHTEGGLVWLPPLMLTVGLVWLAHAAGRSAARRGGAGERGNRWRIIGGGLATYAAVALALAVWSAQATTWVPWLLAPIASTAVFAAGFATAVVGSCGGGRSWRNRVPDYLRAECRAAAIGLGVALAASAAAVTVSVALSWPEVAEMSRQLRPGISGTAVLALASLIYLPTAAIWGLAFVAGPGVTLGRDSSVALWSIVTDELPAFPLLAAIPARSATWLAVGVAIPLLGGLVAAAKAPQPVCSGRSGYWASKARIAGFAGVGAAVLATAASGSLGGRMSPLGPSPALMAGATVAWFLLAAALWWVGQRVAGARLLTAMGAMLPSRRRKSAEVDVADSVPTEPTPPAAEAAAEVEAAAAAEVPAHTTGDVATTNGAATDTDPDADATAHTPVDVSAALSALLASGVPIVLTSQGQQESRDGVEAPVCAVAVPESATVVLGRQEDAPDLAPSTP